MKTLKIIVFAVIAMFGFASCSDEKKVLNFVSEEVVADNKLNDFLIRNNILEYMVNYFKPELEYHLSLIRKGNNVSLPREYAHFMDEWYYYHPGDKYDSDIIINSIIHSISERVSEIVEDTTIDLGTFTSNGRSKDDLNNCIISLSVHHYEWLMGNSDSLLALQGLKYSDETIPLVCYDWLVLGLLDQQEDFINKVVSWIISKCYNDMMSKNYKLVDKQCITVGENKYEVTYLFDPLLKLSFDISKVGKTFVVDYMRVEYNGKESGGD